jgi:hypothetical protein
MPALLVLLALCLAACSHAPAQQPPPPDLEQVLQRGPEAAEIHGLGPGATSILDAAAHDERRPSSERAHALRALAFAESDAQTRLQRDAEDAHFPRELRLEAVRALLHRLGRAGAPVVQPVLDDPDPKLRVEVARALGALGGPLARQVLEARLDKESDAGIREALQKSLTEAQP